MQDTLGLESVAAKAQLRLGRGTMSYPTSRPDSNRKFALPTYNLFLVSGFDRKAERQAALNFVSRTFTKSDWRTDLMHSGVCLDGAVAIFNNSSEREMKRVVLHRKNSLFVGNPRGGRTAAILATLTSTCRRHDIDPQLYLTQPLTNVPGISSSELPYWLPDKWKRRHSTAITAKNR